MSQPKSWADVVSNSKPVSQATEPTSVEQPKEYPDDQQIFVGNIPWDVPERELFKFFEEYGPVEELRMTTKEPSDLYPNHGYVIFKSSTTVKNITEPYQCFKYKGHRLLVQPKKSPNADDEDE